MPRVVSRDTIKDFIAKERIQALSVEVQAQYRQAVIDVSVENNVIANKTEATKIINDQLRPIEVTTPAQSVWRHGGMKIPHLHCDGKMYKITNDQWNRFVITALDELRSKFADVKTISFDNFMKIAEVVDEEI
ncbi:MAG: hypothetical protein LBE76_07125 [Nitrososphaerota archaeon]|nr:hypothetical protein [Nitrososphaerota archaeon]